MGSDRARPSIDRPAGSRDFSGSAGNRDRVPQSGSRDLNRSTPVGQNRNGSAGLNRDVNRDINSNVNRDINRSVNTNVNRNVNRNVSSNINRNVNQNWNRRVDINNVNVNPGWARAGWGVARPWNNGWYGGWSTPAWGWWGASAAAWGVGTLATAAIINNAVDNAISANQAYILVPSSNYQLLYGSIQPSGTAGVTFAVSADGSTYQLTADCNSGLLDGRQPQSAAEAELLNAACQVAFGSV